MSGRWQMSKKRFSLRGLSLGLQVRVVIIFLLVMTTLVTGFWVGGIFYQWWNKEYYHQVTVSTFLASDLVSSDIEMFRRVGETVFEILSDTMKGDSFDKRQTLDVLKKEFAQMEAFALFDREGKRRFFIGDSRWDSLDLLGFFSGKAFRFSNVMYEVVNYPGEKVSYLLLFYEDGERKGVGVFSLQSVLAHFRIQLQVYRVGIGIVDQYGSFVIHTDISRVAASEGLGHLGDFRDLVRSAAERQDVSGTVEDQEYMYIIKAVSGLPWFVVIEVSKKRWMWFFSEYLWAVFVILGTSFVVSLVIAVQFSRFLERVFRAFVEYTKAMLLGRSGERAERGGFAELEFFISTVEQLVTSLRQEEEQLRYSRQMLQEILNTLSEGILLVRPDGTAVYINQEASKMLGISPRVEMDVLIQGKSSSGGVGLPLPLLMAVKPYERRYEVKEEVMIYGGDGQKIWLYVQSKDWCNPDGNFLGKIVTLMDITSRKVFEQQLQTSEKRLSTALETANAMFWEWFVPSDSLILSKEWEEKTRKPLPSFFKNWLMQLDEEEATTFREKLLDYCYGREREFVFEHRLPALDREIWVLNKAHVVERDLFHQPLRVIGVMVDITTLKEQQKLIEASLAEKEMLLREIHHRVKNNLQIISSLLSLQMDQTEDDGMKKVLLDSQVRVRSMALVHEKLYQTKFFAQIPVKEYLEDLVEAIRGIYDITVPVELEIKTEDLVLPLETCIPVGLWLSEVVTNAFKYAFRDHPDPKLRIEFLSVGNQLRLEVADNGPGLDTQRLEKPSSLGMKLIHILGDQLGGLSNKLKCHLFIEIEMSLFYAETLRP
ncbi:histidine kinase dimerization/phosphoacceptor domain -containing protein [Thermospira aquatica]|uniref:histidine kinase n=1 Tax=Thermospira aquatica TaxID=2828656 RepID=A0AAX3BGG0_9SPIR|nr:histidine kinase dimerization/phosphoacceptor domain -containing protein [Thermospira aquatica]URA11238.1 ATP-binding protein [Thermospira aquatica]